MSEERRRLASLSDISLRTCRQTVGKLCNFCCMVLNLNLQRRIQQESCHSFSRNLHLLSVCTHTQRPHTLWSPAGDVIWHMSLLSSFTWAMKLQGRELHHGFAEILMLPVDKIYFSAVKCVTMVYTLVALRHLVQGYLLRWSQILFRSTGIFLSWGAQLCLAGFFFYSFWVPKEAFYSSSVPKNSFNLHICI